MLIAPPTLAIVAATISHFDRLNAADQLRAAALALKRDFSIDAPKLKLVARSVRGGGNDRVLIGYTTRSENEHDTMDLRWFDAVADGAIVWIDAPHGFVVSSEGAAVVEEGANDEGPPAALMSLAALTATSSADRRNSLHIVIDDVSGASINEATLDLWRAALGARIERRALPGSAKLATLVAPPKSSAAPPRTNLDRALLVASCAALVCAGLSLARYVSAPTTASSTAASASALRSGSGELWSRATLAAPKLAVHMKSATYGGGSWVIAAPSLEKSAVPDIVGALNANALSTQVITEPETRIRVQRP